MPPSLRPVRISAQSILCPAGIGPAATAPATPGTVPGFKARAMIPERKSIKLMSRAVQLGVAAIRQAIEADPSWESVPPARRALFVGASPQAGDAGDLGPALETAWVDGRFDMGQFAETGIPRIHPLWLVRGLSNNVLGFASANHDMQGVNRNYCDGDDGGWLAICEAWWAVAEGRADLAVAGGADALTAAAELFGETPTGEGAAFVVFRAADPADDAPPCPAPSREALTDPTDEMGLLGAATWPVAYVRARLAGTAAEMCKDSANR